MEITLTWYCFTALVPFCHKQHEYKKCYEQLEGRKELSYKLGMAEDGVWRGGSSSFCTCVAVLICTQSVCVRWVSLTGDVFHRKWVNEGFP